MTLKWGWTMGLCALAAVALAHQEEQSLTLTAHAKSAQDLISELGRALGQDLRTDADVARDRVSVRWTDVPAREALEKLAGALSAEWVREGEILRLSRSNSQDRAERRASVDDRAARIRDTIAKELSTRNGSFTEAQAREFASAYAGMAQPIAPGEVRMNIDNNAIDKLRSLSPQISVLYQFAARVDARLLASLAPDERIVFSSHPTQTQAALGQSAQIVGQFARSMQLMRQAVREVGAPAVRLPILPIPDTEVEPGPPALTLLAARRLAGSENYQLDFVVADAQGNVIGSGGSQVSVRPSGAQQETVKEGQTPIALSDRARVQAEVLGTNRSDVMTFSEGGNRTSIIVMEGSPTSTPQATKPTGFAYEMLLNPGAIEPLSLVPSELAVGWAEAQDADLIAVLPDSALLPLCQSARQDMTPAGFRSMAEGPLELEFIAEGSWVTLRPRDPALARDLRLNREAMDKLMKLVAEGGLLSLDQQAAYVVAQPVGSVSSGFDMAYVRALNPAGAPEITGRLFSSDRNMLRFWGTLGASQRQLLRSGSPLALGALSQASRAALDRMIFHGIEGVQVEEQQDPRVRTETRMVMSASISGGALMMLESLDPKRERTVLIPRGIPPQGSVTLRITDEDVVRAQNSKTGAAAVMNAGELGMRRAIAADPQMQSLGQNFGEFDGFVPGKREALQFSFTLGTGVSSQRTLFDTRIDSRGRVVAFDQLPEAFRQSVAQAQQGMGGFRMGSPGRAGGQAP